jgi:hypothetical protein
VLVDLGVALPPDPGRVEPLPLRIRQRGLRLGGEHLGYLLAWARTSTGHWLALVRVTASAGAAGWVEIVTWVPGHTVREGDDTADGQR